MPQYTFFSVPSAVPGAVSPGVFWLRCRIRHPLRGQSPRFCVRIGPQYRHRSLPSLYPVQTSWPGFRICSTIRAVRSEDPHTPVTVFLPVSEYLQFHTDSHKRYLLPLKDILSFFLLRLPLCILRCCFLHDRFLRNLFLPAAGILYTFCISIDNFDFASFATFFSRETGGSDTRYISPVPCPVLPSVVR